MPISISDLAAGRATPRGVTETTLLAELRQRATALGFEAFGVARADARPDLPEKLDIALARDWHGEMAWMAETAQRRGAPEALWPEARSVIMVGMNYGPETDPMADLQHRSAGNISVYARNRDYHDIIKGKLKELAGLLNRRTGAEVKVFVDTAPVMEKPLGEAAGIGWQGKHTVLVSREHGSWLFLGAIFTSARAAGRRAAYRKLRQLQALPRYLPHQRLPRAVPARCATLPQLP